MAIFTICFPRQYFHSLRWKIYIYCHGKFTSTYMATLCFLVLPWQYFSLIDMANLHLLPWQFYFNIHGKISPFSFAMAIFPFVPLGKFMSTVKAKVLQHTWQTLTLCFAFTWQFLFFFLTFHVGEIIFSTMEILFSVSRQISFSRHGIFFLFCYFFSMMAFLF